MTPADNAARYLANKGFKVMHGNGGRVWWVRIKGRFDMPRFTPAELVDFAISEGYDADRIDGPSLQEEN